MTYKFTVDEVNNTLEFTSLETDETLTFMSGWEAYSMLKDMTREARRWIDEHPCHYGVGGWDYESGTPDECDNTAVPGEEYCEEHMAMLNARWDRDDYEYDQYTDSLIDWD